MKEVRESSYKEILKSSVLIGGSQIVNIFIGLIKNKVLALLLGPSGIGIFGVLQSVSSLASSVSNLGLNSSSVKQIAEADATDDKEKLWRLVRIIRIILIFAGLIAATIIIIFSKQIAILSFGSSYKPELILGITIVSLIVLFDNMATGERGILQGLRQLKALASGQILGAALGAIVGIALIFLFGYDGIPFYLVATSLCAYLISRYQVSKLKLGSDIKRLKWPVLLDDSKQLITLGLAFVITVLAGNIVSYIERILIIGALGISGVGIYQASWGLVNMSFNLVLVAMATDFYPRLVNIAHNPTKINKTVNEQVEITLLVALPILLVLYVFCPILLSLLYSQDFVKGIELTKWLSISCFFRVLCWPLGYIIIAKGNKMLFILTSIIWEVIHIPILMVCMKSMGLEGIGLSYVIVYALVTIGSTLVTFICYTFKWSKETIWSIIFSIAIILILVGTTLSKCNHITSYLIGSILIAITTIRSVYIANHKFNLNLIKKIRNKFNI